ncbi:MAG: kelch repeat-containing protein [Bacteroidota bacterium]
MRILCLTIFLLMCFEFTNGQGTWTQKATFPGTARFDAMSFSIGKKGYIVGGIGSGLLQDFWEYNAASNNWQQKSNFPGGNRCQGVSFSIGAKGYIGTGGSGTGLGVDDFWEYDTLTYSWTQKANLPANGRYAAAGFSIGNKGYIGAGQGGSPNVRYNDFWEYAPTSNSWTQKANLPIARAYGFGFSIGTKGYIGTGNDSTPPTYTRDDFLEYDPTTDNWISKTSFPGGKRTDIDGGCFVIGNFGYVGTGTYQNTSHNDFWVYNPINDTWASIPSLSIFGRIGSSSFSINNRGYVGLGNSGSNLNDLWEYSDTTLLQGIIEIQKNSIHIYPNPFSSQAVLRADNLLHNATLTLDNSFGQTVRQIKNISGKTVVLSRDNLPSGVYFLRLTENNEILVVEKLVVADK